MHSKHPRPMRKCLRSLQADMTQATHAYLGNQAACFQPTSVFDAGVNDSAANLCSLHSNPKDLCILRQGLHQWIGQLIDAGPARAINHVLSAHYISHHA